jgi:hypothetical protein
MSRTQRSSPSAARCGQGGCRKGQRGPPGGPSSPPTAAADHSVPEPAEGPIVQEPPPDGAGPPAPRDELAELRKRPLLPLEREHLHGSGQISRTANARRDRIASHGRVYRVDADGARVTSRKASRPPGALLGSDRSYAERQRVAKDYAERLQAQEALELTRQE